MTSINFNWRNFLERGDNSSFSALYNNFVEDLVSYGVGLGFETETCKDAIQDVFYKIYISKSKLSHVENVAAYIFKSFKYRLIDFTRKNKTEDHSRFTNELATESFAIQVTVLDSITSNEKAQLLQQKVTSLLNSLTANQREVVYLRYMVGLSYKEIADILGINEASARKLLYRTMEKMRQQASNEDMRDFLSLFLMLLLVRQ